jgi:sugar O-acyltransferase (sialic acid O-acetyltransferase NeuD family)
MSMKKIVILGAGGLAKEIAFLIDDINKALPEPAWQILGYIISDFTEVSYDGKYPVIGNESFVTKFDGEIHVAIGIGIPSVNAKITSLLEKHTHVFFPNLVHPSTIWDAERITMGKGNIICAGNIFTTDIQIGSFNIFNLNGTFGHDMKIDDYCIFNPGTNMSGGVAVQSGCLIGTGATVLQYKNINAGAIVGAGSVVVKDVPANATVIGVPAK